MSTPSDRPPQEYLSVAPDSHIVFPPSSSAFEPVPSTVIAEQKTKGVYSHDPILDRNPDDLWRFLVANLKPPRLAVCLTGYHFEKRKDEATKIPGLSCNHRDELERVTDFCFKIDVSGFITPWSQLYALPNGASVKQRGANGTGVGLGKTLRKTVEEYTSSWHPFKEFRMRKRVLWDTWQVDKLLTTLVRSTGYRGFFYVRFHLEDYKVVALASNKCSRSAHSRLVRAFCCLSCLCFVFWPAWAIARKRMKYLTCEYHTTQSADEFLATNSSAIVSAVRRRLGYESYCEKCSPF